MKAIAPRAILLIVLGTMFGPLYYAYCAYFSGNTEQTHTLTERADRWTLPDGSIQRTRSGLAFKPLTLALDPEMNKVQLRFTFRAGETPAGASGTNEYGLSLTYLNTPFIERTLRVDLTAGRAATLELQAIEIAAPGDYAFLLQEAGAPAVPVTAVDVEVRRNVETPNPLVVAMGVTLVAAGIGWILFAQLSRRR